MSGRATLIHAAFRKSEEIDDEKGEKGEFAVNSSFTRTMRTWCFTPTKALILRRGAPRRPARPALFHARRTIGPAWHPPAGPFGSTNLLREVKKFFS